MRKSGGFSLIELLIVLAILGILAGISLPLYNNQMVKSRRGDAKQVVLGIATKQSQYLFDARGYTQTIGSGGLNYGATGWNCTSVTTQCTNSYYTITVSSMSNTATPPTYTIKAAPISTSSQAADGDLTLDNTGAKTGNW